MEWTMVFHRYFLKLIYQIRWTLEWMVRCHWMCPQMGRDSRNSSNLNIHSWRTYAASSVRSLVRLHKWSKPFFRHWYLERVSSNKFYQTTVFRHSSSNSNREWFCNQVCLSSQRWCNSSKVCRSVYTQTWLRCKYDATQQQIQLNSERNSTMRQQQGTRLNQIQRIGSWK